MQKIRSLHLYLGCIFAPMLLFFAASGIWQMLGIPSEFLKRLSTIHTSHTWKNGQDLDSPFMKLLVLAMAISFIVTTILGVMMALKFGRSRKTAWGCLAIGIVVPVGLVLLRTMR